VCLFVRILVKTYKVVLLVVDRIPGHAFLSFGTTLLSRLLTSEVGELIICVANILVYVCFKGCHSLAAEVLKCCLDICCPRVISYQR
jgi:hypothetical protein